MVAGLVPDLDMRKVAQLALGSGLRLSDMDRSVDNRMLGRSPPHLG